MSNTANTHDQFAAAFEIVDHSARSLVGPRFEVKTTRPGERGWSSCYFGSIEAAAAYVAAGGVILARPVAP